MKKRDKNIRIVKSAGLALPSTLAANLDCTTKLDLAKRIMHEDGDVLRILSK